MRIPSPLPITALALFACFGPLTNAQAVKFERVWPAYRDAASFTRLGEYFGGSADATNQATQRTQPDQRAGYYWLVRTASAVEYSGCTIKVEIYRPGQTEPTTHTFPFPVAAGSHATNVGLTGTDWSDPTERPIAWQLTLLSPEGTALAAEHSFLWQHQTP